jgi:hypothetical protein
MVLFGNADKDKREFKLEVQQKINWMGREDAVASELPEP